MDSEKIDEKRPLSVYRKCDCRSSESARTISSSCATRLARSSMACASGSGSLPCSRMLESSQPAASTSGSIPAVRTMRPGTPTTVEWSGDRANHHRTGPDFHVVADPYVAEHLGARADHHVVAQRGVALALLLAGAAQRHALVEQHVVADLGGLADDHAHAVVDEEAPADGGARVDLDARQAAADLREEPRKSAHPPAVELVRHPVHQDRMETRVAEDDLEHTGRSGIFPEDGVDLLFDCPEHLAVIIADARKPPQLRSTIHDPAVA